MHRKTGPLVEYADGRPFAWVDDEQSERGRAYAAAHRPGAGLLHRVDPRIGLGEDDFRVLAGFTRPARAQPQMFL